MSASLKRLNNPQSKQQMLREKLDGECLHMFLLRHQGHISLFYWHVAVATAAASLPNDDAALLLPSPRIITCDRRTDARVCRGGGGCSASLLLWDFLFFCDLELLFLSVLCQDLSLAAALSPPSSPPSSIHRAEAFTWS